MSPAEVAPITWHAEVNTIFALAVELAAATAPDMVRATAASNDVRT
jgi:hypothetical protein